MAKPASISDSLDGVLKIAKQAGELIQNIRQGADLDVVLKSDESPQTRADRESNAFILSALEQLEPATPIIAEEGPIADYQKRKNWNRFWLVDPLDGTKEFIAGRDEFTVNIALIENDEPILGVIYLPAMGESYFAEKMSGSFFQAPDGSTAKLTSSEKRLDEPLKVIGSRSHDAPLPEDLKNRIKIDKLVKVGSSIKFGYLARGEADLYVRYSPCMEWDVAAGDCVFRYSRGGGGPLVKPRHSPFTYNSESLRLEAFCLGIEQLNFLKTSSSR